MITSLVGASQPHLAGGGGGILRYISDRIVGSLFGFEITNQRSFLFLGGWGGGLKKLQ